jgi:Lon protease-like protein
MKILESDFPLFPLNTVLFPQARLPLQIFEPRYREMIDRCLKEDLAFGVLLIKEGEEVGEPAVPYQIGTVARIVDSARLPDGKMNIVVTGVTRFKLLEQFNTHAYITGHIELLPDENVNLNAVERDVRHVTQAFKDYVALVRRVASFDDELEQDTDDLELPQDPTVLSYTIAMSLPISMTDKQSLLESSTTRKRLNRELLMINRELGLLRLVTEKSDHIRDQGSFSLN